MKVTDEMVERAEAQWREGTRDMRLALEAALADVPDLSGKLAGTEYVVRELEAKLGRVRAWLDSDDCDGTESLHWHLTLRDILGEDP